MGQRKSAEADVQLLANRLQHLRNEDHNQLRLTQKAMHKKAVSMEHDTMTKDREGRKAHIQHARNSLKAEKTREFLRQKALKQQQGEYKAAQVKAELERAQKQRKDIKRMHEERLQKKKAAEAAREMRQREKCRLRMLEEEEKKVAAEAAIAAMEKEEEELIARLRKTQEEQRGAYDDLKQCLQSEQM